MSQINRTDAIKNFLQHKTHADLAELYNYNMEVQVNVAQDSGSLVEGEFKGRKWRGWTDNVTTWKPFRIPRNAYTTPEYTDVPMSYDLSVHAEGIGMTGWDWYNQVSRWVAFDFDAITGHSEKHLQKLTDQELRQLRDAVSGVEWVTVRHSTSGSGLHLYVHLGVEVTTKTHTEHAALARAILGKMSAETGLNLQAKVDACGQNMWVWHRKMEGTDGLKIIKIGRPLMDVPANWRDHVDVVSSKRKRTKPKFVEEGGDQFEKIFDELTNQRTRTKLDDTHRQLIKFCEDSEFTSWFDADHNMLVTHTFALKQAHEALQYKGIYDTLSTGSDSEHNCFCYPLREGGWVVRRYTRGVAETKNWDQDRQGMTRCFYNREPDLKTVCLSNDAVDHPTGGFSFNEAEVAAKALTSIGIAMDVKPKFHDRQVRVKENKDGKIIVELAKLSSDSTSDLPGWIPEGSKWKKVFNAKQSPPMEFEAGNYDDVIRHVVDSEHNDCGWMLCTDNVWRAEPISHIQLFLKTLGVNKEDAQGVLGSCITRCWTIVNRPFEPEYPGERQWNKNSPQFVYPPSENLENLKYPTWLSILQHCGSSLDAHLHANAWARDNGINTGADYLKCWIASVFQKPEEPLPYLFLYNTKQNTGKSLFHEALSLLCTAGIVRADQALTHETFNGELQGAVICIIEETDVSSSRSKKAYNRIKDWVTSRQIQVRNLYESPRTITNTTHWIQCSNDPDAVPIFPGDTRIVMLFVPELSDEEIVAKRVLIDRLKKEAPDFLAEILNLEIPTCNDRLNIPVINTPDKEAASYENLDAVHKFILEKCYVVPGSTVLFSEFYDKLCDTLEPEELGKWSKVKVGKTLDKTKYPKGRIYGESSIRIGNVSFTPAKEPPTSRYVLRGGDMITLEPWKG